MKNKRITSLLALVVLASLGAYFLATRDVDKPLATVNSSEANLRTTHAEPPDRQNENAVAARFSEVADDPVESEFRIDPKMCRTDAPFVRTMLRQYDKVRLRDVRMKGEYLENYRGLSSIELNGLIDQGDTDALVVQALMVAYTQMDIAEVNVIPLMLGESELKTFSVFEWTRRAEENGADFGEARRLLYEAALGGRVEALSYIGLLYMYEGSNAVDLGWLSEDVFEQLPSSKRSNLSPPLVYRRAMYVAFPEIMTSDKATTTELLESIEADYGDYWASVVLPIADRFLAKIADSDQVLPPVMPRITEERYLDAVAYHCSRE